MRLTALSKLITVMALSLAVGTASLLHGDVASAAVGDPARNHNNYGFNNAENSAWWMCNYAAGTAYGARGAIWFANSGASYYTQNVVVADGQNSVPVQIAGSVYACMYGFPGPTYAINIAPRGSNGWRLTGLSSTSLYRGRLPSPAPYYYSSQGNTLAATLNVTGLATNNATSPAQETITIDLYRCMSSNGTSVSGSCYAQPVEVTVIRTPPAPKYTNSAVSNAYVNGSSSVAAADAVVYPGDTVLWRHNLTTTQTAGLFSSRSIDYTYACQIAGVAGSDRQNNPAGSAYTFSSSGTTTVNPPGSGECYGPYTIRNEDVGSTFCHRLEYAPKDQTGGSGASPWSCVRVMARGGITPILETTPTDGSTATDESSFTARFKVKNDTQPAIDTRVEYSAWIWYEKSATDRTYDPATGDSRYFDTSSTGSPFGSGGASVATVRADGSVQEITMNTSVLDMQKGGRVCAAWRISTPTLGVRVMVTDWLTSCVLVGRSPTVQIWGNDGRVGSAITSGLAAASGITGKISTREGGSTTGSFSGSSAYGLWRTGVDASGSKIAATYDGGASDKDLYKPEYNDQHWTISGVVRPNGSSAIGQTCQYSFDGVSRVPMDRETPAYVVVESSNKAGIKITRRAIVGNASPGDVGTYVWGRTSTSAGWIGQNVFGQNYNDSGCRDPSALGGGYDNANIYKFKLKDKFTVPADADLSTVKLTIAGAIDNRVKAFVNGCQLLATGRNFPTAGNYVDWVPVVRSDQWLRSGYWAGTLPFSFENANTGCQSFKPGADNVLELWVQSTVTHTGLMIEDISLSGSMNTSKQLTYGSWGEYSMYAPDAIRSIASASGLAAGSASDQQQSWSQLTHANVTIPYGSFAPASQMGVIPNIGGYLSRPGLKGVNIIPSGAVTIDNAFVNANQLMKRSTVIQATGTVTITATNMTYDTSSDDKNMNQLVIVAPDINIQAGVGRVDAWLIAPNGTINTCSNGPGQLTINDCNQPLQVNGALTASHVLLRRTAGADKTTPGGAAETLNLRGDAYIWSRRLSELNGTWTTRAITELPPRY